MKTLTTAATIAALALCSAAFGQGPGRPDADQAAKGEPVKQPGKALTPAELGDMLRAMGYEAKPVSDKDGKLVGQSVSYESEGWTIYCSFQILGNRLWLHTTLAPVVDETTPAAVLLAMHEVSDSIFPACLFYAKDSKKFSVLLPVPNEGVTAAALRGHIETYTRAVKAALNAYSKAVAAAKEKAEGQKK
jgi:hypothetical protein